MTTMTTIHQRSIRSAAPTVAAVVAAAALGVAVGFWADGHGSTTDHESRVLSAAHGPSAGFPVYEAAKLEQIARADVGAAPIKTSSRGSSNLEARKLEQMDAADAAITGTLRADMSANKLAQMERNDASTGHRHAATVTERKLAQVERNDAALPAPRDALTVSERKLRQMELRDAR